MPERLVEVIDDSRLASHDRLLQCNAGAARAGGLITAFVAHAQRRCGTPAIG
jgi:hypothetical protein